MVRVVLCVLDGHNHSHSHCGRAETVKKGIESESPSVIQSIPLVVAFFDDGDGNATARRPLSP